MALSEFLVKTFADQRSRAHQAGQAVLEYILILVITVSIILGILYQFNDAFKGFLDNYFGDYIACLLETGELPALGGSGPSSSSCVSPMQNFSLASGNALGTSSSGGGSSGGGGNDSSSESGGSGGSPSSGRSGRPSRPSTVTRSGAPSNAEAIGRGNNGGRPASIRKSGKVGGTNVGFNPNGSGSGFAGRGRRTIRKKRIIYLGDSYLTEDAKKKKKKSAVSKSIKSEKQAGSGNLRSAKMKLDLPEQRALASDDEESSLNFGNLIKLLLIAGILVAIFIFLGGQAVQIKKSWQKSE